MTESRNHHKKVVLIVWALQIPKKNPLAPFREPHGKISSPLEIPRIGEDTSEPDAIIVVDFREGEVIKVRDYLAAFCEKLLIYLEVAPLLLFLTLDDGPIA